MSKLAFLLILAGGLSLGACTPIFEPDGSAELGTQYTDRRAKDRPDNWAPAHPAVDSVRVGEEESGSTR